ncbi:VOC family protein [Terriglobus saanensis]|uniref:Glyoxalase/bleomycin resistance protein/dioxygenase n=1 Tax=Terriglobus saanensis (strain ATCC BAA-1853 / DSM 23119 / SP1PR4) TaxID=401053 RepID=E8V750_TERSS|nr:VOC family protein [Terriglobus saanensis]ADV81690.1 Glyoxalase/bleomycin resistance protein/dioxygenase [Terriglobus saanensis SP1PR4]
MLYESEVMGFIPTVDAERARTFYEEVLGLHFVSDDPFALVMEARGTVIRIAKMEEFQPAPYTILGWRVQDIEKEAKVLHDRGVSFRLYPGMSQDDLGIWTAPGGTKIAWFQDPDGNVLSLSQH